MESEIGGVIHPQDWMPWKGDLYLDTLLFAEYGNHGAGAGTDERVDGRVDWSPTLGRR
ncbi:Probable pectinesterase/pectinesterase inhibitor 16 [Linum grandiflorum]